MLPPTYTEAREIINNALDVRADLPWIVGRNADGSRLAAFAQRGDAEEWCADLPNVADGHYYIDGPED